MGTEPSPSMPRAASPDRHLRRLGVPVALVLLSGLLAAGCVTHPPSIYGHPGVSSAPQTPWDPPAKGREGPEPIAPLTSIPPDLLRDATHLSLSEVVDVALRTSTRTRAAWEAARSAAAAYGSKRGEWFPSVGVGADVSRQKSSSGKSGELSESRTYGASGNASWLLFNFGGRKAEIEETRQALVAADWTHNQAIQDIILQVTQAYYGYLEAKALLSAEEATLTEAQKNLDAAQDRHNAGLATIVDVLQSRTAVSEIQLSEAGLRGQIEITRGALATSMGLPANLPFDVEPLPEQPPVTRTMEAVDSVLDNSASGSDSAW